MRTVAIVQARMGSTRLPGKVLMDIEGKPTLQRVVERIRRARRVDEVVVATSDLPADDAIERFCGEIGVACFRGSEGDVLDRYHGAAAAHGADVVVRITADCPLLDPAVVDRVIAAFHEGGCDYAANCRMEVTYPDGLDTEVFSRDALERAWAQARLHSEREHVTPYIWNHPERFALRVVRNDRDLSALRWTLDEPDDLAAIRAVYAELGGDRPFGMEEVLDLLARRPELAALNAHIAPNAGYLKSLEEDA
jgi:spore coat polysaccharide biosynthesis protein SpsF (cytidylyltransferase family)